MEARATLKFARISPRKVKIVMDLIRNQDADKAMAILKFTPKAACEPLEKLLASAWQMLKTITIWMFQDFMLLSALHAPDLFLRESVLRIMAVHTAS